MPIARFDTLLLDLGAEKIPDAQWKEAKGHKAPVETMMERREERMNSCL